MSKKVEEKRTSYLKVEIRAKEEESQKYLDAYFIKYNEETELWPGFFEEVAPEAVVNSLRNNDIVCLFNHIDGVVLGRTSNNTLELNSDSTGLFGTVEINENDAEAMNIYSRVKRGDITACSFGFQPIEEEFEDRGDGTFKTTIKDMNLIEVSIVTFPAYPSTEASARKKDINRFKKEVLNKRKNTLKEKLKLWQIQ